MKKSLLLIDLFLVIFIVFACRNSKESKPEVTTPSTFINDPVSTQDTSKTLETSTSGLVGTGQGIQKDTDNAQAIIHPAPNKAKIDSIKNLKTKNKR
ncbi:MAG TPA: hypothetical protein PKN48_02480 [Bacteroidales bacterium]|nr:hypothetical protein [Bacteroidales bacterium]